MRSAPQRPGRRSSALLLAAVLPLAGLAACGSDDDSGAGADSLTVSGTFGQEPEVEFDGQIDPDGFDSTVAIEGDGAEIEEDDVALISVWVGNGFTESKAYDTFASGPGVFRITTAAPSPTEAQVLQQGPFAGVVDPQTFALPTSIVESLVGKKAGSRVVVASDSDDAFGALGQPGIGIGNKDGVVFVVDVLATALDGPEGTDVEAPAGTPALIEEGAAVTGFDFTDATPPTDELQVIPLVEGDGPVVEEGATLIANYLGQVFEGEAPFDESYSGGLPRSFVVGGPLAGVIEGWNQSLVGLKAGSRVVLVIPPELGYGAEGNEGAGITGTDTLYFVVDVLGSVVVPEPLPVEEPTTEPTDPTATDPAATDPAATEPADPSATDPAATEPVDPSAEPSVAPTE
ncbi:FKBP-type peptidyl-prolyl cis-trans isomerase [Nocardioides alkalitolerans]|uniref:FKBP-type peptidyl-prolyl cis-trans isomerase n=1 Tax=Nocardioides alkalitolerans TaxID=281714 RepID=UPI000407EE97|nr:FKBP-type peptidyl-prolyl cis-trans isomerase [Nocardioides alkalitolerans]